MALSPTFSRLITDLIKPNPGTTVAVTEEPWNGTAANPRNRPFQATKNNNTKAISQSTDRDFYRRYRIPDGIKESARTLQLLCYIRIEYIKAYPH